MRKIMKWVLKAVVAGMIALPVASIFCLFYSNPSIHSTNQTGATDYIWEKSKYTATMTEGISWRKTDENGFFNTSIVSSEMDVLLMGSSHAEAQNVFAKQSVAYLLEEGLDQRVYNIAMSGHTLLRCVKNLEDALSEMRPTGYVVIETSEIMFSEEDIAACLGGKMQPIPSYDSGLIRELQKIPYLRLAYGQLSTLLEKEVAEMRRTQEPIISVVKEKEPDDSGRVQKNVCSAEAYNDLMSYLHRVCISHGVHPVIFYHPTLILNADGTTDAKVDADVLSIFQNACKENDITFVDMTQDFLDMYKDSATLPHGFCNTKVGRGHLNKYGHAVIASRLIQVMTSLDDVEAGVS